MGNTGEIEEGRVSGSICGIFINTEHGPRPHQSYRALTKFKKIEIQHLTSRDRDVE